MLRTTLTASGNSYLAGKTCHQFTYILLFSKSISDLSISFPMHWRLLGSYRVTNASKRPLFYGIEVHFKNSHTFETIHSVFFSQFFVALSAVGHSLLLILFPPVLPSLIEHLRKTQGGHLAPGWETLSYRI